MSFSRIRFEAVGNLARRTVDDMLSFTQEDGEGIIKTSGGDNYARGFYNPTKKEVVVPEASLRMDDWHDSYSDVSERLVKMFGDLRVVYTSEDDTYYMFKDADDYDLEDHGRWYQDSIVVSSDGKFSEVDHYLQLFADYENTRAIGGAYKSTSTTVVARDVELHGGTKTLVVKVEFDEGR